MPLKPTHAATANQRDQAHKGRGASLNLEGRFEHWSRVAFDDHTWDSDRERGGADIADASDAEVAPNTVVTEEVAKSIISTNDSPDIPFRYSVNPYRGCEHGCVYCFARPSHAYLGLSPGLDFETRLFAKVNAAALLREALDRPSYQCDVISLGINTDAYQPIERRYGLTRALLEVMQSCRQPVGLITKSALIERDIDVLGEMAQHNLAAVCISLTTLNHDISRLMEPRTSAPRRRLQTVERLAKAGIPVSVNIAPVIPFLTDSELESILQQAADAGATRASYILLRLPWELKPLFRDWLHNHFPLKAMHVMSRLAEMRDGRENDPRFGTRMVGEGVFAKLLAERFARACARAGLNDDGRRRARELDTTQFRAPRTLQQPSLF
jgi:DNA repair photolyase